MTRRPARWSVAGAGMLGVACLGAAWMRPHVPLLLWNLSASAPEGLYHVVSAQPLRVGDTVIARVPGRYRALASARRYIAAGVLLVKRIAAGPGDQICALGDTLFLNGVRLVERRRTDGAGRSMPAWQGCVRLGADDYFLLMASKPLSFDGRYFGITVRRDIVGKARLLWAR